MSVLFRVNDVRQWAPLDVVVASEADSAEQKFDQCLLGMHPILRLLPDY